MTLPISISINGLPATEIAAHTPPVFETWADGGCGSASWAFAMSAKRSHRHLYPGALVQIKVGMHPLFSGRLSEPDRSTWECIAYGHASHAERLPALDGSGNLTHNVATATTSARSWGWVGADPFGVITGTVAGNDSGLLMLANLLKQRADELGKRWGVNAKGQQFFRTDPTIPTMYLAPDIAVLGQTDEGLASHIGARYINSTTNTVQTVVRPSDGSIPVEAIEPLDFTPYGAMSETQAYVKIDGLLAKGRTQAPWTSGMTVHRSQLQVRGVAPFLPKITAGVDMVRLFGIPAARMSAGTTTNVVIGKTKFDAATPDLIYLEPLNTAPRTFADILAAA